MKLGHPTMIVVQLLERRLLRLARGVDSRRTDGRHEPHDQTVSTRGLADIRSCNL